MDRHGDAPSDFFINPITPLRRVEKKGRKWRAVPDASWDETLRENLEKIGASAPEALKKTEEPKGEADDASPWNAPQNQGAEELMINSAEDFEKVIGEIKKMADEPEKLIESHIKVFIEPVSNGKWVDSQG
ncbi:MAG: hypothetical protein LBL73_00445 [Synergistaceae bacterium]|jgi:hypothetical protein|nr:hypothetical protein [Synergistaceae bacterium]